MYFNKDRGNSQIFIDVVVEDFFMYK